MSLNLAKLKEKYEKKASTSLILDKWQPKEGENSIRILPHSTAYFKGEVDDFVYPFLIHYGIGSENKTVVCPKTLGEGHKCPICEDSSVLFKSNDESDKEKASDIYRKKRFLINVLDLKDVQKGIQIFEFGPKIYNKLMRYVASGLFGDILDLEKGRNIVLVKDVREGKAQLTDYDVLVSPDASSVIKYLPQEYMQKIDDLVKAIPQPKTYNEIKSILGEGIEDTAQPAQQPPQTMHQEPVHQEQQPPKTETPVCYGKEFSLKSAKCRPCVVFETCKKEFIRLIDEG
jgi:hypothetical protein